MEKLQEGRVYYIRERNFFMIGKVIIGNNGANEADILRGNANFISSGKDYSHNGSWSYKSRNRDYRFAIEEEENWLNDCMECGKFIKRDITKVLMIYSIFDSVIGFQDEFGNFKFENWFIPIKDYINPKSSVQVKEYYKKQYDIPYEQLLSLVQLENSN